MKKILLLFLLGVLMPITAGAQTPTDDTFTVSDLTFVSDNIYSVTIGFNGSRLYTAYNLEITMPQGLDVLYVESEGKKMAIVDMYEEDDSPYPDTQSPTVFAFSCQTFVPRHHKEPCILATYFVYDCFVPQRYEKLGKRNVIKTKKITKITNDMVMTLRVLEKNTKFAKRKSC